MKVEQLFQGVEARIPPGAASIDVRALAVDSRAAGPGSLFAALPGVQADGASFAAAAVSKGAAAVLAGRALDLDAPVIVADKPRLAFSLAAANFHSRPSEKLQLVGVTGTNGKTTTAYLVEQLSTARGLRAGLLGTVEVRWPGERIEATHTTPESHELQALLARMVAAQVQIAAMEVSSHALEQERAAGCRFAAAAFTNLTRDHLDYHRTMEAYFDAKARLFRELLPAGAPAVINLDDAAGAKLAAELRAAGRVRVIGFATNEKRASGFGLQASGQTKADSADLIAEGLQSGLEGISFQLNGLQVKSPLIGAHNAENLLTAFGLLVGLGMPLAELVHAAAAAKGAPGRLERVPDAKGRHVFVDYAHTDDALARVLDALVAAAGASAKDVDPALREAPKADSKRVIAVFGCGGDRDKGKRPLMGEAAGRRADLTIATSDNPRTEEPLAILAGIEPGLARSGRARLDEAGALRGEAGYVVVADRRAAIELALQCARPGDAVLIAGKGHEPYQIVGTVKHAFDDRLEAARALEQRK